MFLLVLINANLLIEKVVANNILFDIIIIVILKYVLYY